MDVMLVISGVIESRYLAPVRLYTLPHAGADNWTTYKDKRTDEDGIQIMDNSNYTCTHSATTAHTTLCNNKSTNEMGGISSFRIDPLYRGCLVLHYVVLLGQHPHPVVQPSDVQNRILDSRDEGVQDPKAMRLHAVLQGRDPGSTTVCAGTTSGDSSGTSQS
ncbi:hypothetical protein FNAPI_13438 [Fusarium napiforme]|uniref:Uncharacterized protein n=1 Tax=Fusarium napiforme TaxID=42672 RepID=A0A8H5I5G2_9HYPO|nr:hypothetical protein FNAPI_13438 [Fusarium napiforme]